MQDERNKHDEHDELTDALEHIGVARRSGRYPWGSGENPYQGDVNFLAGVRKLRDRGMTDKQIYRSYGMNSSQFRKRLSLATAQARASDAALARRLREKGMGYTAIGRRMGVRESSVRSLLRDDIARRQSATEVNAKILKDAVDKKGYIDVTKGTELYLGISSTRLNNALYQLEQQGYTVHNNVKFEQLGTGKQTTMKVLAKPGTTWADVMKNRDKIQLVDGVYSEDGGQTMRPLEPPRSVSSKRVEVRFAEDGGTEKDGLIELRRGVDELSLKDAKYAQVRIAVDGTHYLKGMAIYSDDLPPGVDIRFNTNKSREKGKLGAMKEMNKNADGSVDTENPFGASIKGDDKLVRAQRHYLDADGKEQLSALNIVNEEGDWAGWRRTLASQFLGKQNPELAKRQLNMSYDIAKEEFDEIKSLTNPTVRNTLMAEFASKCDSDAVHLAAAALPRQTTNVIIPFPEMKANEIYAPGYETGEHVALVRYPHGGIFEIPTLTVNNNQPVAKKALGQALDAVGINHKVAEQLSGADFDGDNVIVIPIDNVKIRTSRPLKGLEGFDPKAEYPAYKGMHVMTSREKGLEMGKVSNLITDMTIQGAPLDEICRAVKHSMVVIDAEKHKLDYRQSEIDNRIDELRQQYQSGGASTLLSRSTAEVHPLARKEKAPFFMTPEEKERYKRGELVYEETGRQSSKPKLYAKDRTPQDQADIARIRELRLAGQRDEAKKLEDEVLRRAIAEKRATWTKVDRRGTSTQMAEAKDAYELVSTGKRETTTPIERVYADYANRMKALAQEARRISRQDDDVPYDPSAARAYAKEVASLRAKLNRAMMNAPLERQAQLAANAIVRAKVYDNPELRTDQDRLKKLKGLELDRARQRFGAKRTVIGSADNPLTDREWEAINAGAVHKSRLREILKYSDTALVKRLSMPRSSVGVSPGKVAKAKAMLANGYTQADVARALDVSVSTLIKAIDGNAN